VTEYEVMSAINTRIAAATISGNTTEQSLLHSIVKLLEEKENTIKRLNNKDKE